MRIIGRAGLLRSSLVVGVLSALIPIAIEAATRTAFVSTGRADGAEESAPAAGGLAHASASAMSSLGGVDAWAFGIVGALLIGPGVFVALREWQRRRAGVQG
ncbi:MAG: hypothetical protein QM606_11235 [Leucobacter sp.]